MAHITIGEFLQLHPQYQKYWSEKNPEENLSLTLGSRRKVWFTHLASGLSFEQRAQSRWRGYPEPIMQDCPVEAGKVFLTGANDLATLHPLLAAEWSPKNDLSPTQVSPGSHTKVGWVCSLCGGEWEAKISNRTYGSTFPHGCPTCNSRQSREESATPTLLPAGEKVPAFMRDAYRGSTPVSMLSREKTHWQCPHNPEHTWECSPRKMFDHPECPYCAGRVVRNGKPLHLPSLATITSQHPDHPYQPCSHIDPHSLSVQSAQRITVRCDQGHLNSIPAYFYTSGGSLAHCPQCHSGNVSAKEQDLVDSLTTLLPDTTIITTTKQVVPPYELDLYIPEKRIAVEFNGLYWHSEERGKDRNYHKMKHDLCREKGIQLITVWEDDWDRKRGIVLSMILHKLGASSQGRVFSRSTTITAISASLAREFCGTHHIQGFTQGSLYLGAYHGEDLVSVSVWRRNRSTLYLDRYCTSRIVVGGMGKMLKKATTWAVDHGITEIVTFSDNQVSDGGLYEKLGFVMDRVLPPDYCYLYQGMRTHKFNFRLKRFRENPALIYQEGLSERELARLNGIPRIWDCGKMRWRIPLGGD